MIDVDDDGAPRDANSVQKNTAVMPPSPIVHHQVNPNQINHQEMHVRDQVSSDNTASWCSNKN